MGGRNERADSRREKEGGLTMKKMLFTTFTLIGFGFLVPLVTAQAEEPREQTDQKEKPKAPAEQAMIDALKTKIALAQAKVAELEAKVALEIERLPENAGKRLDEADAWLLKAKETALTEVAKRIDELREEVRSTKEVVTTTPAKARAKIDDLTDRMDRRIEEYKQVVIDTDEAKILKQRYAQLEAQASLLRARLAEKVDETGKSAISHLDMAKAWYAEAMASSAKKRHETLVAITERIEGAKETVKSKRAQAGEAILDLSKRAADLVRGPVDQKPAKEPSN